MELNLCQVNFVENHRIFSRYSFVYLPTFCVHYPLSFYTLFCFLFIPLVYIYIYIYIYIGVYTVKFIHSIRKVLFSSIISGTVQRIDSNAKSSR